MKASLARQLAHGATLVVVSTVWLPQLAAADDAGPVTGETGDAIYAHGEVTTAARLFQRPLTTAAGGVVASGIAAPLYHHALLRVRDVDTPWAEDSVDVELSAWGNLELGDVSEVHRLDGDVMVARVTQRFDHARLSAGRMVRGGGAARFARFDGVEAGLYEPVTGLGVEAYGGLSVLPRWSQRDGYQLLGSTPDTLLRDPTIVADTSREGHWLVGGRLYTRVADAIVAGASFHEQREDHGLARRNAALDATATWDTIAVRGLALMDLDAASLADARLSVDAYPTPWLTLATSYQHLAPALLLSRQSVLSVFSTETFDEWGMEAQIDPWAWLRISAEGFVDRFDSGAMGTRSGGSLWLRGDVVRAGLGYRRVLEERNGYHGLRASTSVRPARDWMLTADAFLYAYDRDIAGVSQSLQGIVAGHWRADERVAMVLSGSLARSPFSALDAQAIARIDVSLDGGSR